MQRIELFQVDAFTNKVFYGNPAAVCLLDHWLNDELMQAIAAENNLSETAFILQDNSRYHLRWFTPNGEIGLCGHATLAAAFVLFELQKNFDEKIVFESLSGDLTVFRQSEKLTLDFPKLNYAPIANSDPISNVLDMPFLEAFDSDLDYLVLMKSPADVLKTVVDTRLLALLPKRGLILTAKADDYDFYSRCFYPKYNIIEDPVTGSAHCVLAPFWSERLNKSKFSALQGSVRKGNLTCEVVGERVRISGSCKWYLKGELII